MLKEWDFTPGMLNPTDGWLVQSIVGELGRSRRIKVMEIGVWRGTWLFLAARSPQVEKAVGIDPYPNIPQVRADFLARVEEVGLASRVSLFATPEDYEAHPEAVATKFEVIHVDGEHTQRAAEADLKFSARHLADDGVIIADDYYNLYYPGVAVAVGDFLRSREFAVFLLTQSQAYLCRAEHYSRWRDRTAALLAGSDLVWGRYIGDRGGDDRGMTLPTIHGHSPLLCLDPINDQILLRNVAWPLRARIRHLIIRWLPPAIREWLRPPLNLRTMPPPPAQVPGAVGPTADSDKLPRA